MRAHGDSSASSITDTFAQAKNSNNSFLMVARRVARSWAREKNPVRRTAERRGYVVEEEVAFEDWNPAITGMTKS